MHQRDEGTHGELPLKAERQVQHDPAQRQEHTQAALVTQLLTHLRPDELDLLHLELVARPLQHGGNLVAQIRVIALHTYHHLGGGTKALHHGIAIAGARQMPANAAEVCRLLIGQLDLRTAGKIQAKIQAFGGQTAQRDKGHEQGEGERNLAHAHEVNYTTHLSPLNPQLLQVTPAEAQVDHGSRHQNSGEHRGENAQRQCHRKAFDRTGTHGEEDSTHQ